MLEVKDEKVSHGVEDLATSGPTYLSSFIFPSLSFLTHTGIELVQKHVCLLLNANFLEAI